MHAYVYTHTQTHTQTVRTRHSSIIELPIKIRYVVGSIPHSRSIYISRSNQCYTTSVTKALVCIILWKGAYKKIPEVAAADSLLLVGPLR